MQNILSPSKKNIILYLRILYPLWMIVGMFSLLYVPSTIIVTDNASETAANILDNQLLFRLSIAGGLITQLIQIIVVILFFKLFSTVNRAKATILLIFTLVGVPISMVSYMPQYAALLFAQGPQYLSSFEPDQLHSLSLLFWNLHEYGILIASLFWGLWLLPLGYLAIASKYFPKFIGYALYVGGIGYFVGTLIEIIFPNASVALTIFEAMTIGEMIFIFWLLILGAKLPKIKNNE